VEPTEYTEQLRAGLEEFWARYQELKARFEINPPPIRNIDPPADVVPLSERQSGYGML
jgi:hypothetical protein